MLALLSWLLLFVFRSLVCTPGVLQALNLLILSSPTNQKDKYRPRGYYCYHPSDGDAGYGACRNPHR